MVNMQYAVDIAAAAVLVLFVVVGLRRGFIKSCASFCGGLLAMIGACLLSAPAAEWLFEVCFRSALEGKITEAVAGLGTADAVRSVLNDFPELLQRALAAAGVTEGSVVAQLQNGAGSVAAGITTALSPMLIALLRVIAMLVLFVLLFVVIRALAMVLSGLFQLPILHQVDGLLGAVFGLMLAILVLWVALAVVRIYTPMLNDAMEQGVNTAFSRSYIAGALYAYNPVYALIS